MPCFLRHVSCHDDNVGGDDDGNTSHGLQSVYNVALPERVNVIKTQMSNKCAMHIWSVLDLCPKIIARKKQMMISHSLIMSHGSFEAIPSLYFCVQNDGWKNCRKCFLFPFSSCVPLSFVELYSFDEVLHRCWKSNL